MKIKFETTVKTSENTKERMVCLDISENIKSIEFEHPIEYRRKVEQRISISIISKFRSSLCICREKNCGCWSSVVTMIAVDLDNELAIAHMKQTQRI